MVENRTSNDDFVGLRPRLKRLHRRCDRVRCTNGAGGQDIIERRCKMRGQRGDIAFDGWWQLAGVACAQRDKALHQ